MDDQQRVTLPVEALTAMGWGWDETLELSVSLAGNELPGNAPLLRARSSVTLRCCACQAGRAAAARRRRKMAVYEVL